MTSRAGDILEEAILSVYTGFTTQGKGGNERIIRCFECLDSDNPNHAHLSISLVPPFYYHCQRCKFGGAVNESFLERLGVRVTPELSKIIEDNRAIIAQDVKERGLEGRKQVESLIKNIRDSHQLKIPKISAKDIEHNPKYEYLCNRFEKKFSVDDLERFKVVLDLKALFRYNMVARLPADPSVLDGLVANYIGFMDYSGSTIIHRSIYDNLDIERYYDLNFKKNHFRFYTTKRQVDISRPVLKIAVAEGIMDVIGVYNAFPELREEYIFVAMLGKGLVDTINFFLKLGFLDQDITIFSDPEISKGFYSSQLYKKCQFPKELGFKVSFAHNTFGLDFGHPANKIQITERSAIYQRR
jgi:hypothetical protein